MPPDRPVFSIVTPTLNRLEMIKEAVDSVRRQRHESVEHIIVDGGSTDGTQAWVEAQPDLIYLPPPDRGVYDAMNKGIAAAQGEWIGLLNSDDYYDDGAFAAVEALLAGERDADVVAGHSCLVEGRTRIAIYDTPQDLIPSTRDTLIGHCLPNPRFFRRELFRRIGPLDPTLGLVADRDFLLRLIEAGARTVALEAPVYVYRRHEGSLTFDANLKLSRRLRLELIALGRRWRLDEAASAAARAAGRELEGRQRLALASDAARSGRFGEASGWLFSENGRRSIDTTRAVLAAAGAFLARRQPR